MSIGDTFLRRANYDAGYLTALSISVYGRLTEKMTKFIYTILQILLVASFVASQMLLAQSSQLFSPSIERVSTQDILQAMQSQSGYDPTMSTNVARFQAEVLLSLAGKAVENDSAGTALFIGHKEWFDAYLVLTGLTKSTAPVYARLAYQHKQDLLLDFGETRVIKKIEEGHVPFMAINVIVGWPHTPELPSKYTFEDTLSTPNLKVTNHREITYRLLDFGDVIVYDEIKGLSGRPTSGLLAVLFKIIGEGRVVQSRIAITPDGLQINRARAEKGFFGVSATVTVQPNGITKKGLPQDRPELQAFETLLKRPLKIKYIPLQARVLAEMWVKGANGKLSTQVHFYKDKDYE